MPVRAVLLDALGTMLELRDPVEPLRRELGERLGLEVGPDTAHAALAAEISFYRAHHLEGRDGASLAALRLRCAEVLLGELGEAGRAVRPRDAVPALLAALEFRPYPEVPAALAELRGRGLRLVVVSNWDVSLHGVLARTGLSRHMTGAVTSAEAGEAKPATAIFERALAMAGVPGRSAVHCGDSPREDLEGAHAAGVRAVLMDRGGGAPAPGHERVGSLRELAGLLD
jgi:putative hydrolase of the HAD superfamily